MFSFYHTFPLSVSFYHHNQYILKGGILSLHNISSVGVRILDIIAAFFSRRWVRRADAILMYSRSNNKALGCLNKEIHDTRTYIFEVVHTPFI